MSPLSTPTLMEELRTRVQAIGPLNFAEYMQLALYHPDHGYYARRVPGNGAHFRTSASASPWFGRMVAVELRRMWDALGRPDPFTVIEFGAGLAGLAKEAIRYAGELRDCLRWRFVEQFDRVQDLQRDTLGPAAQLAEWRRDPGPPVTGCVLANEVLDNFPVRLFQRTRSAVMEVFVEVEGDRVRQILRPPECCVGIAALGPGRTLAPGDRFELCFRVRPWLRAAAAALDRGYLLIVDYGDEEPAIWRRGAAGTIKTYGPLRMGTDPFREPGSRDITADVDFTNVCRMAAAEGFDLELLALQRFWMVSLGLPQVVVQLADLSSMARSRGEHVLAAELDDQRRSALALADPEGLGGCLVFRASKGFGP